MSMRKKTTKNKPKLERKLFAGARFPTLLGLFFLAVLFFLVYLVDKSQIISSRAGSDISPVAVRVTNVTDRSFTVSWTTSVLATGFVRLFDRGDEKIFADLRRETGGNILRWETHYVMIDNLKAETEYQFLINSGGKDFRDEEKGAKFKVKTAKIFSGAPPEAKLAFGRVVDRQGLPVGGAIVYLDIPGVAPLSSLSSSLGNWMVPLAFAFDPGLAYPADYREGELVEEIVAEAGSLGNAKAVNYTANNKPVREIILGESLDFTNMPAEDQGKDNLSQGRLNASLPEEREIGFSIVNPEEGEGVYTLRPEVFGFGPENGQVEITLESPVKYTGDLKIGSDGKWRWSPPGDLELGEHKLTVRFTDANGREQTLIKNFTVLAAGEEGLAFTATASGASASPSASPTPTLALVLTATPTMTLTPTPTTDSVRTTMPSTDSGVPQTGRLTPLFILFTMGLTVVVGGIIFRKA